MGVKVNSYSNLKIFHHHNLLDKVMSGEHVAPLYVRIKPTNICNQNCYYCHYKNAYLNLDDYRREDFIPREKMIEIVQDMRDMGVKAVTFSGGGEPLLYPYINETMQKIIENNIELSIITNGTLLKNESAKLLSQAKWVRISLDANNADLYSRLRGVSYDEFGRLCAKIEGFAKIKNNDCEFGINYVVSEDNYGEIYNMAKLMKSLGVNHVKYTPVISNTTEVYHEKLVDSVTNQLTRAKNDFSDDNFRIVDLYTNDFVRVKNGTMIFERNYENCYIKEFVCVIAANSKVYYCHDKAYISNGTVADLVSQTFKEAWFSKTVAEKFKKFSAKQICNQHCVYDDRNILLNTYFALDKNNINFI